jgi:hypothetical protein
VSVGNPKRAISRFSIILMLASTFTLCAWAGEKPFFITYTDEMQEPGSLQIASENTTGKPSNGNRFLAGTIELEYGINGWWTSELYLDGQVTGNESTSFTGYRWENRFRLLQSEHWINPVFYFEFDDLNPADKDLLEVVGHDGEADLANANEDARRERKRELEAKLILGSHFKGWTVAENFIVEKNVRHEPYQFGYAVGLSRPLALVASPERCNLCLEKFQAGIEAYGGLGTHSDFGLHETSHYVAPTLAWTLANGTSFKVSPGFGITKSSASFLLRFGVSYEIGELGRATRRFFSNAGNAR